MRWTGLGPGWEVHASKQRPRAAVLGHAGGRARPLPAIRTGWLPGPQGPGHSHPALGGRIAAIMTNNHFHAKYTQCEIHAGCSPSGEKLIVATG